MPDSTTQVVRINTVILHVADAPLSLALEVMDFPLRQKLLLYLHVLTPGHLGLPCVCGRLFSSPYHAALHFLLKECLGRQMNLGETAAFYRWNTASLHSRGSREFYEQNSLYPPNA